MAGNLIGVNTFILSRSGSSSGVGFAIPATLVRRVVETAIGGGRSVQRPWLGAKLQGVDAEEARSLGLDRPQGVVVASVYPGGPADRAGVRPGDLILTAEGAPVNDEGAVNYSAATHRAGDTVRLGVRRAGGATREVAVQLAALPGGASDQRTLSGRQPLSGATVVTLTPASADAYGLDPFSRGVALVQADGIAASQGFRAGDIVKSVNGQAIASTAQLARALQVGAVEPGDRAQRPRDHGGVLSGCISRADRIPAQRPPGGSPPLQRPHLRCGREPLISWRQRRVGFTPTRSWPP